MSMWGFARNATKQYVTKLNAASAVNLVNGGWKAGMKTGVKDAFMGAGRGYRTWATRNPRTALTSGIRIGSTIGAGLLAGNVINPKDNWGPF